ncbi:putative hydrolase [Oscillibacter valericigenes Sjm18-20]|nr:putative hydrolase [Oscillibacter valericigenes Sjm18-20]
MKLQLLSRVKNAARRLIPFVSVTVLVLTACWFTTDRAAALYILTDEDDATIVLEQGASVADFSSQMVYIGTNASGFELTLAAGWPVTVLYDGASISTTSRQETVSELLNRVHTVPGPLDMVAVDLQDKGLILTVASDLTYYEHVTESAPYQTEFVNDPTLEAGTQKVVQTGADGICSAVYEVSYSGGERVSRQLVSQEDSTAVDEIVHVGTAPVAAASDPVSAPASGDQVVNVAKNADGSGTLTLASGATLNFGSVKSMTATAYTKGHGGADNCTATGTAVRVGVVAVDKRVIPLGTKLYIVTADGKVTYGMAVAEDTGVSGNIVDLYYDTYQQCIDFGRRAATVYVLN